MDAEKLERAERDLQQQEFDLLSRREELLTKFVELERDIQEIVDRLIDLNVEAKWLDGRRSMLVELAERSPVAEVAHVAMPRAWLGAFYCIIEKSESFTLNDFADGAAEAGLRVVFETIRNRASQFKALGLIERLAPGIYRMSDDLCDQLESYGRNLAPMVKQLRAKTKAKKVRLPR
ncbi:hypothetical protein [Azorhizobium sp. AG788]|uniref:hypothetical protein n=1 Tax=Azorhizobium sp. AG788 TaxID=2183897 RepID=UPI003138B959